MAFGFNIKMVEKNSGRTTADFQFNVGYINSNINHTPGLNQVNSHEPNDSDIGAIGRQLTLGVWYETYVNQIDEDHKLGFIVSRSANFTTALGCLLFKNLDSGCSFTVPFPISAETGTVYLALPYIGVDLDYEQYNITDMQSLKSLLGQFRQRYQFKTHALYRMGMEEPDTAFFVGVWHDSSNRKRIISDIYGAREPETLKGFYHNLFCFWNWYIFLTGERYHPVQYLETLSGEKIYLALPISEMEYDHMLKDYTTPYFNAADLVGKPCISYDFQTGTDLRRLLPIVGSTLQLKNGSVIRLRHEVNNYRHYYYYEIINQTELPTVILSASFQTRRENADMVQEEFSGSLDTDLNYDYIQYFVGNNNYPCRLSAVCLWGTPYEDSGIVEYIAENSGQPATFWNQYPTTPITIAAVYTAIWDIDSDYTASERETIWGKDDLYTTLLLSNVTGYRSQSYVTYQYFCNLFSTIKLTGSTSDIPSAINTTNGGEIKIDTANGARRLWGISSTHPEDEPESGGGSIGGGAGSGGSSIGGKGNFDDSGTSIDKPPIPNFMGANGLWNIWDLDEADSANCYLTMEGLMEYLETERVGQSYEERVSDIVSLKVIFTPVVPTLGERGKFEIKGNEIMYSQVARVQKQFSDFTLANNIKLEPYFGSFLDYSPYTKVQVYLPFAGTYDLNTSDLIGKTASLSVRVDWMTGNLLYTIRVNDGNTNTILYRFTGNSAVELPLTATDYGSKVSSTVNTVLSAAATLGSLAVAVATEGAAIPALIAAAGSGMMSNINAIKAVNSLGTTKSKGSFGSSLGAMDVLKPYLIVTRPKQVVAEKYGEIYGYPSMMSATLSTLTGYIKVAECQWKNLPNATDEEIAEIDRLLKTEGAII